jgi:Rod binding domain-containing protein
MNPGLSISACSSDFGLAAALPADREGLRTSQLGFSALLGRASADPTKSNEERAREAAQDFVAQTFVQPFLKMVRESDRTPAPFGPSQGEKQFRALMDVELARRIVHAQHFPLVDRLARDLLKQSGSPAP